MFRDIGLMPLVLVGKKNGDPTLAAFKTKGSCRLISWRL